MTLSRSAAPGLWGFCSPSRVTPSLPRERSVLLTDPFFFPFRSRISWTSFSDSLFRCLAFCVFFFFPRPVPHHAPLTLRGPCGLWMELGSREQTDLLFNPASFPRRLASLGVCQQSFPRFFPPRRFPSLVVKLSFGSVLSGFPPPFWFFCFERVDIWRIFCPSEGQRDPPFPSHLSPGSRAIECFNFFVSGVASHHEPPPGNRAGRTPSLPPHPPPLSPLYY